MERMHEVARVEVKEVAGAECPSFAQIHEAEYRIGREDEEYAGGSSGSPADAVPVGKMDIKRISEKYREVFHVEIPNFSGIKHVPGDSLSFRASNPDGPVLAMLDALSLGELRERAFSFRRVHKRSGKEVFSYRGTVWKYFKHFFDFSSIPSKAFLYQLFLSVPFPGAEAQYLKYLCSREGSSEYFSLYKRWISIVDIIGAFGCRPSLETVLAYGTEIKPRSFSLTNGECRGDSLFLSFICGAMRCEMEGTSGTFVRHGHTSGLLMRATERAKRGSGYTCAEDCIYGVELKPNRLMRMEGPAKSFVLFGLGTGIAPFISFIRNMDSSHRIRLFYGCRDLSDNILRLIGLVDGEHPEKSRFKGAVRCSRNRTKGESDVEIEIVYSRDNSSMHMDKFIEANRERIAEMLRTLSQTEIHVCARKEVQNTISTSLRTIVAESGINASIMVDDWS
jgi:sulfite reductase alpha subunit-like flavoprotein